MIVKSNYTRKNTSFVKTRFYLVLPILTGSTCRNRRHEVEPRTNERVVKSRSDGTLLTVSFNLRIQNRNRRRQSIYKSRKDSTLPQMLYRSCGSTLSCVLRRLKSTVNKVSSLRDLLSRVA